MGRVGIAVATGAVLIGVLGGCGQGAATAPGSSLAGTAGTPGRAPAPAAPTVHTISVKVHGGKASGDTGKVTVPLGTPVVISVSSDVADQIHVQGYERTVKVPAASTASVAFTANKPGTFDVGLDNSKLQLLQLQVG
ncbi:MAG: hypothetical protein ACRDRO_09410 [Pseudonocardiaceae bacterium]